MAESNEQFDPKFVQNQIEKLNEVVVNSYLSRAGILEKLFDRRRSINDECGYKETEDLSINQYKEMYDRESIAKRVVNVLPKHSWKTAPSIFETEDLDEETEFERAWSDLARSITIEEESHFEPDDDDLGNPIWDYLKRVDILSGIGFYGTLFLGVNDGTEDLSQPIKPGQGKELLYLRAFDESLCPIARYVTDPNDRMFGRPAEYDVSFYNPFKSVHAAQSQNITTKKVHSSRMIHIADNLEGSEVIGVPRMQSNWNRLHDLRKVYGGSAEMYWRGAFPGLSFELHPQAMDAKIDMTAVKAAAERYMNTLQRYLVAEGMTVKTLAPQVVDPSPQIDAYITAICIELGIPKRIFMGSERGELSSGQDKDEWDDVVDERRNGYLTPRIIVPFINRLISLGILPVPKQGYKVKWPDPRIMSESEKAELSIKRTEALAKYIQGGVDSIIAPMDYLVRFLDVPTEEAEEILKRATEEAEADEELEAEKAAAAALLAPPVAEVPPAAPKATAVPPPVEEQSGGPKPTKV